MATFGWAHILKQLYSEIKTSFFLVALSFENALKCNYIKMTKMHEIVKVV